MEMLSNCQNAMYNYSVFLSSRVNSSSVSLFSSFFLTLRAHFITTKLETVPNGTDISQESFRKFPGGSLLRKYRDMLFCLPQNAEAEFWAPKIHESKTIHLISPLIIVQALTNSFLKLCVQNRGDENGNIIQFRRIDI